MLYVQLILFNFFSYISIIILFFALAITYVINTLSFSARIKHRIIFFIHTSLHNVLIIFTFNCYHFHRSLCSDQKFIRLNRFLDHPAISISHIITIGSSYYFYTFVILFLQVVLIVFRVLSYCFFKLNILFLYHFFYSYNFIYNFILLFLQFHLIVFIFFFMFILQFHLIESVRSPYCFYKHHIHCKIKLLFLLSSY